MQTNQLSAQFQEAFIFVAVLHADQFRKGTQVPYISHLMGVAGLVLEHGGSEDEAIAALLHDTIEDQAHKLGGSEAMKAEIQTRFGQSVLDIVLGCTDAETNPKPPWRERKEAYILHLEEATPSVLLVSLADKVHNARSILTDYRTIGEAIWERFRGGRDGTLWYYRALVEAFSIAGAPFSLLQELTETVEQLEELSKLPN